jgi:Zinc carboxypeptidase
MNKHFFAGLALAGCAFAGKVLAENAPAMPAPASLAYYLPHSADYDPAIPLPSATFGFEVGEWHLRHDQIVRYLELLAAASDRIELEVIGFTHERRPLVQLLISSPTNLARREELRRDHLARSEGNYVPATPETKIVVNLGYSVHGNEPSGAQAAVLTAYHLAAACDRETLSWLDQALIVLDPVLNPDGLDRFALWANNHRGQVLVADPNHREHREGWPTGRTNHYFFDLNRDWLLGQQPETQARLARFHAWRPNVLTDFHEMGTNSTYFFQPGVPSRKNPLTPGQNVDLTFDFARAHGRQLDEIGSLYYTRETFDDYYYGKGSTYPDIQGAIGILFEQASSRGHLQESENGLISFPFTIRNQVMTSMTTLATAVARRVELLDYQSRFYRDALAETKNSTRAYVFGSVEDPQRAVLLAELLRRHAIDVETLSHEVKAGARRFQPGSAFAVPLAQRQQRLIRALFEQRTLFADPTFYDVSAWTLPLAFNLPFAEIDWPASAKVGPTAAKATPSFSADPNAQAYILSWHDFFAPRALARLLAAGVVARVATETFQGNAEKGAEKPPRALGKGSIVMPLALQKIPRAQLEQLLQEVVKADGVEILSRDHGLAETGLDLGSPSVKPLPLPRPALIVGHGLDAYEVGDAWFALDHRFGIATTLLERERLSTIDLARYSHLIVTSGRLNEAETEAVGAWVKKGGILVAIGTSAGWLESALLRPPDEDDEDEVVPEAKKPERRPYEQAQEDKDRQLLSGAIFETELDLSHPLAWGYAEAYLPLIRSHENLLKAPPDDPYAVVAAYRQNPLLAGYASPENLKQLALSPAVIAERFGRGAVIRMADNPNFRGYWQGGARLFMNSLFFGHLLEETTDDE